MPVTDEEAEADWDAQPPDDPPSPATAGAPEMPQMEIVPEEDPFDGNGGPPPVEPDPEPDPVLDPKYRQDFDGLLFVGKLEHTFTWLGHKFRVKTIDGDALLEIGLLHRPYAGSLADVKAYQQLIVAACLVSVDGKALAKPGVLDPDDSALNERWEQVRQWFAPTIDQIYEQYLLLESRLQRVLDAMGEASG